MKPSTNELTHISKITLTLCAVCVAAVVAYIYFLNQSVVSVVLEKDVRLAMQELKNEIAILESDYIAAQHTIAARMVRVEGLEVEHNKIFVARGSATGLVLNR